MTKKSRNGTGLGLLIGAIIGYFWFSYYGYDYNGYYRYFNSMIIELIISIILGAVFCGYLGWRFDVIAEKKGRTRRKQKPLFQINSGKMRVKEFCPKCGEKISPSYDFCLSCNSKFIIETNGLKYVIETPKNRLKNNYRTALKKMGIHEDSQIGFMLSLIGGIISICIYIMVWKFRFFAYTGTLALFGIIVDFQNKKYGSIICIFAGIFSNILISWYFISYGIYIFVSPEIIIHFILSIIILLGGVIVLSDIPIKYIIQQLSTGASIGTVQLKNNCKKCGVKISPRYDFCPSCSLERLSLDESRQIPIKTEKEKEKLITTCSSCGQELSLEAVFCAKCGEKVGEGQLVPLISEKIEDKPEITSTNHLQKFPSISELFQQKNSPKSAIDNTKLKVEELHSSSSISDKKEEKSIFPSTTPLPPTPSISDKKEEKLILTSATPSTPIPIISDKKEEKPILTSATPSLPIPSISIKEKQKPKLPPETCKFCGLKLTKKAKFCPQCGMVIKDM